MYLICPIGYCNLMQLNLHYMAILRELASGNVVYLHINF